MSVPFGRLRTERVLAEHIDVDVGRSGRTFEHAGSGFQLAGPSQIDDRVQAEIDQGLARCGGELVEPGRAQECPPLRRTAIFGFVAAQVSDVVGAFQLETTLRIFIRHILSVQS